MELKDFTFETKNKYGRYERCSVFYKGKYVALFTDDQAAITAVNLHFKLKEIEASEQD